MALDDGDYTLVAENAGRDSQGNQIDLEYEVKLVKAFAQTGDSPFSSTPAINPENSLQYNLSGKTEEPVLEFKLYDDGTDRSNGTLADMAEIAEGLDYNTFNDKFGLGSTIETIQEQKIWLKNFIHNYAIPVEWRLYGGEYTDKGGSGQGTPVVIQQTEPRPDPERPNEIYFVVRLGLGRRII
ncbi:MAG: hypothetical protein ACNS64_01250 [Candidatus Halalkalibacterium sp. M3_1C_030]